MGKCVSDRHYAFFSSAGWNTAIILAAKCAYEGESVFPLFSADRIIERGALLFPDPVWAAKNNEASLSHQGFLQKKFPCRCRFSSPLVWWMSVHNWANSNELLRHSAQPTAVTSNYNSGYMYMKCTKRHEPLLSCCDCVAFPSLTSWLTWAGVASQTPDFQTSR